ncbi:MAG TPA: potassium channel protein [Campylobacterales bacterium]|nr:potassium channel protein [Campylobacterales bacterium]
MNLIKKLKKQFNWREPVRPHVNLNTELYVQLAPFKLPLILVVMMMMFGTLGYMAIDDFKLIDAIYQTGITFTTVGFGEIHPISNAGRVFTITLIILGFVVFSFSVGLLVEVIKRGELIKIIKERSMLYNIARLKNHYVICNHNDFTIQLTRQFRENHIPFVVVDSNENLEEEAKKYNYPYYVNEEPHTEAAILKSHLSSAKGVITLSDNMADNIAVIASVRLYEQEIKRRRKYFIMANAVTHSDIIKLKKLGADSVISPTKLMAQRMSAISQRPEMENILEKFLYKKDTLLDIEEVKIPSFSWLLFKKLKDINLPNYVKVHIVGIKESEEKEQFIPMPDLNQIVTKGSKLMLIGSSESIKMARKVIGKKQKPKEIMYV